MCRTDCLEFVDSEDYGAIELSPLYVRGGVKLVKLVSIPNSADPMLVWFFSIFL